jgi:hypothetical protein
VWEVYFVGDCANAGVALCDLFEAGLQPVQRLGVTAIVAADVKHDTTALDYQRLSAPAARRSCNAASRLRRRSCAKLRGRGW